MDKHWYRLDESALKTVLITLLMFTFDKTIVLKVFLFHWYPRLFLTSIDV